MKGFKKGINKTALFLIIGILIVYSIFVTAWWTTTNVAFAIIEATTSGPTIVPGFVAEFFLFNLRGGKEDITELKLNNGGLNYIVSSLDNSDISMAKKAKYLQFFISRGCGVNDIAPANAFRPLHVAVVDGKADLVELLLLNGANPLLRSESSGGFKNMTPLEVATLLKKKNPHIDYSKVMEVLHKAEMNWNEKRFREKPTKP